MDGSEAAGSRTKKEARPGKCRAFYHPPGSPRYFDRREARNTLVFVVGIMCFKFGFETLHNGIALFAAHRFPASTAVTLVSALTAVFAVAQSLSSIAVAQLMVKYPTHRLLAGSIWLFGLLVAVVLVAEAATGGTPSKPGRWSPVWIFPLYAAMGASLGVLELVRRTIPRDIVGSSSAKLQRYDALVHIGYEVAGVAGAFFSTPLIRWLGYTYAMVIIPVTFALSGVAYSQLDLRQPAFHLPQEDAESGAAAAREGGAAARAGPAVGGGSRDGDMGTIASEGGGVICLPGEMEEEVARERAERVRDAAQGMPCWRTAAHAVARETRQFLRSFVLGAKILCSSRKFSWLIFGYTLPLILHRLLENVIFPTFAKRVLHDGSLAGVMLGSSNAGELVGALFVLLIGQRIPTPMPFVRWDGLSLALLWSLAAAEPGRGLQFALAISPVLCCVSMGWAAGDVSLLAYIQSQLAADFGDAHVEGLSPLGCVMGTLYSSYVILYTLVSILVGRALDHFISAGQASLGFTWIAGVFLSACGLVIVASSFLPPGAWALNPQLQPAGQQEENSTGNGNDEEREQGNRTAGRARTSDVHV